MKKNIAFGGWWSWWHARPIQSLIEFADSEAKFYDKINKVYRFGQKKSMEYGIYQENKKNLKNIDLTFLDIMSGKFRRQLTLSAQIQNVTDIVRFVLWICQSIFFIIKYKIDIIFCKWWFVALPLVIAGKILDKKIFTHESDTRAGIVNRISARFSTQNFCGFQDVLPNSVCVGQILSSQLASPDQDFLQKIHNITFLDWKQKTIVLVTWWSLWASSIYDAIHDILTTKSNIDENFQFLIVGGTLNKDVRDKFQDVKSVHIFDFLDTARMAALYQIADICITRAGVTTLAETKLFELQNIIIPIPRTHDQKKNTDFYAKNFGDIGLDQQDPNFGDSLATSILKYKNYKKSLELNNKKILSDIIQAKQTILNTLTDYQISKKS